MTKTIAFHSNQLSIRGTEVALYDYAHYNEALLNNRSFVVYDASSPFNQAEALPKFQERFEVVAYRDRSELDDLLKSRNADLLYAIKAGKRDGLVSRVMPTMVHAVFPCNPTQAHGSAYAYISEWLSKHCSNGKIPSVPHIVHLPDVQGDLRATLGIPDDALVLGCHGGQKSFDVPCAIEGLKAALNSRADLYAIFLNVAPFVQHPKAIFLPGSPDMAYKVRFINTCDAMLHARLQGESFGLACGEFSIRNKPVITYLHGKHGHHIDVLGDKGFYYHDKNSLLTIVRGMEKAQLADKDWDCYTARYNPATVMESFERHLIKPALANKGRTPDWHINWLDRLAYLRLKLQMRLNGKTA